VTQWGDGRPFDRGTGPRRTRTVFVSLAGLVHVSAVASGPCVSAHESNSTGRSAWVWPGAVPRRHLQRVTIVRPRRGDVTAIRRYGDTARGPICWRSLQLSRCYLGAANQGICANGRHSRRAKGIPRLRRGRRPPGHRRSAPSCVLSSVLRSFRKSKEPPPCGSGSSGHGPMEVQFRPSETPPWEGNRRTLLGRRRREM
jgi:hypothetical protein